MLALPSHGIAVEGGGDGRRGARDIHQNGGNTAAEAAPGKDGGEKQHRLHEIHIQRHGQKNRHGHGDLQAGHGAEQQPDQQARNDHRPGSDIGKQQAQRGPGGDWIEHGVQYSEASSRIGIG